MRKKLLFGVVAAAFFIFAVVCIIILIVVLGADSQTAPVEDTTVLSGGGQEEAILQNVSITPSAEQQTTEELSTAEKPSTGESEPAEDTVVWSFDAEIPSREAKLAAESLARNTTYFKKLERIKELTKYVWCVSTAVSVIPDHRSYSAYRAVVNIEVFLNSALLPEDFGTVRRELFVNLADGRVYADAGMTQEIDSLIGTNKLPEVVKINNVVRKAESKPAVFSSECRYWKEEDLRKHLEI